MKCTSLLLCTIASAAAIGIREAIVREDEAESIAEEVSFRSASANHVDQISKKCC